MEREYGGGVREGEPPRVWRWGESEHAPADKADAWRPARRRQSGALPVEVDDLGSQADRRVRRFASGPSQVGAAPPARASAANTAAPRSAAPPALSLTRALSSWFVCVRWGCAAGGPRVARHLRAEYPWPQGECQLPSARKRALVFRRGSRLRCRMLLPIHNRAGGACQNRAAAGAGQGGRLNCGRQLPCVAAGRCGTAG